MRRKRPRRNRNCRVRVERAVARETNGSWSMKFIADQIFSGQRFHLSTLADNFTRESLSIQDWKRPPSNEAIRNRFM